MKIFLIILLSISLLSSSAQTQLNKNYTVKPDQKLALKFDYPNKIKITTWDKNEISITGKVNINDGENDDAFVLEEQETDGTIQISNKIKGLADLPKRYIVYDNGAKKVFRSKETYKDFSEKNPSIKNYYSTQTDMDIQLEIKVPKNMQTTVNAVYGMVELVAFNGPINLKATYGGIDATLTASAIGELTATTGYGEIFSNLNLKPTSFTDKNFLTSFTAEPGSGPAYKLESTYGNIYLRKSN